MSKVAKVVSAVASIVAVAAEIGFIVSGGNPAFLMIASVASPVSPVGARSLKLLTQPPPDGTANLRSARP
jgi:hypothetical protein